MQLNETEISARQDGNNFTLLCLVCWDEEIRWTKWFIQHGANVNQVIEGGKLTPLSIACYQGNTKLAFLLIKNGADLNHAIHNGATPLYIACENKHLPIVQLLTEFPAVNIDQPAADGITPLQHACFFHNNADIVDLLLGNGASLQRNDNIHQSTALDFATQNSEGTLNIAAIVSILRHAENYFIPFNTIASHETLTILAKQNFICPSPSPSYVSPGPATATPRKP